MTSFLLYLSDFIIRRYLYALQQIHIQSRFCSCLCSYSISHNSFHFYTIRNKIYKKEFKLHFMFILILLQIDSQIENPTFKSDLNSISYIISKHQKKNLSLCQLTPRLTLRFAFDSTIWSSTIIYDRLLRKLNIYSLIHMIDHFQYSYIK